jgi:tetratricopeptide (TPR) repeat protein
VREDLESYRGALAWLIERGRSMEASGIAWNLLFFWVIRGHAAEGLRWYEQIVNLPSLPPSAESRALAGAATMWYTQGELGHARTAVTAALALAAGAGEMEIVAQAENLLGHIEHATGNMPAARKWFSSSVDRFQALAIPWGAGHALSGLAWVALATGDTSQAERLLDQSTSALQHAGPWFLQLGLYIRAIVAVRRGDADEAIALMRESLIRIRALHDKFAFVYALVPLAVAAALKGDDAWAARILGARDAVTERTGAAFIDKSVQDLRESAERGVQTRLGPDRSARAYAAGRRTSIDTLLKDIDRAVRKR